MRDELTEMFNPEGGILPVHYQTGEVTDASVSPPLIQVGPSTAGNPTPCVGSYHPVNGDHVLVLSAGASRLCLGRIGNAVRTFTPTVTVPGGTNPNLGTTGTATGRYEVSDGWCTAAALFAFAGTGVSAGSGAGLNYEFSVPVPAQTLTSQIAIPRGGVHFRRSASLVLDAVAVVNTNGPVLARFYRDVQDTVQNIGPDELAFAGVGPVAGSFWSYQARYQIA